jgi:hypothetical protein
MIKNSLSAVLLFGIIFICSGQQNNAWERWNWLIGEWQGEGSGQPGQGGGTFSFSFSLDSKIIISKSHSEYPASEIKPEIIHDDLMIIYLDENTHPFKAVYFDNEGHTIFYNATFTEKSVILTSDKITDNPAFRLTYTLMDIDTVYTQFEISQDGKDFIQYIEGKSYRISNNP